MKTTVLFPGSFNPVHRGHLAIASYLATIPELDEVRLIVSPHNPLKEQAADTPQDRLDMVRKAVASLPEAISRKITVSDIEFRLPEPRYTWNTLQTLKESEPHTRFILAVGGDNILILEKWHRWQDILASTELWVYPRPGYPEAEARIRELVCGNVKAIRFLADAPQNDISSTQIREVMER